MKKYYENFKNYFDENSGESSKQVLINLVKEHIIQYTADEANIQLAFELVKAAIKSLPDEQLGAGNVKTIVIHDQGGGFRNLNPEIFLEPFLGNGTRIIWKISTPFSGGKLGEFLNKDKNSKNTTIITSTESLRQEGIHVRDWESFESSSYNISTYLEKICDSQISSRSPLAHCHKLIVGFGFGAFLNGISPGQLSVHFRPNPINPFMSEQGELGRMVGYASVLTACIVDGLHGDSSSHGGQEPRNEEDELRTGIRRGVVLTERLFENGYLDVDFFNKISGNDNPDDFYGRPPDPHGKVFNEEIRSVWFSSIEIGSRTKLDPKRSSADGRWSRVTHFIDRTLKGGERYKHALKQAEKIVICGLDQFLADVDNRQPPPKYIDIDLPYRVFGKVKSIDRQEIDAFASMQVLMAKYRDYKDWEQPLSIAVFGPPGSGKNFAIEQILSSVHRQSAVQRLEFNVAQFASIDDLTVAFRQVQHSVLEHQIPLVVFDEFDTNFGGKPHGWLQYFLAPMYDGKFKSGERVYRIGRAIFVFSGGTAQTFEEFYDNDKNIVEFKHAKGLDFVSRLQGHLNIIGVDSISDVSVSELLMFRRAIILRVLLEKELNIIIEGNTGPARIDERVIRAFLKIPKYIHGLRSMEAIIRMSTVSRGRRRFQVASLPPKGQLAMHVEADEFLRLLNE